MFNDQSGDSQVGCLGVLTSAHFPKETPWCCWGFAPETRKRANYKAKKMCSIISHRWLLSLAAWANIYALCHTPVSPHRLLFLGSPENAAILSFWEVVSHWEKTRENKRHQQEFFFIQVDCDIMSVVEPEIKLRFGWKWVEVILSCESQHNQQGPGEAAALPSTQLPSQKYSCMQPGSALRITVITSLHSWTLNWG